MSSELASESRVPEEAYFALCKAAFVLSSPSATALRSGAKDTRERDVPGASRASIDERDTGGEGTLSDQVTTESEENGRPVESILLRTLVGEGDNEGVQLTGVCSIATASSGEVEACDLEGGADAEGSGVENIALAGVSMLPGVA